MLSVILLILKTIGITILVLLGILLLLIMIILFVPIRYRINVEHGDTFELDGGVSWLLHLVRGNIRQSDKGRRIWIRILGILAYDSLRPTKSRKKKNKIKATDKKHINKDSKTGEIPKGETDASSYNQHSKKQAKRLNEESIHEDRTHDNSVPYERTQADRRHEKRINEERISKDSECIFSKIYKKIKAKIIGFIQRIKIRFKELIQKLINIKHKASLIFDFISDDINKEGFRSTYDSLRKILKHILPRRLKSKLIFGTGDPCSTGQALGLLGVLYSIYGDNLQITPDFENKVFKGSHYVKGRIRIWTILIIVIKLLLDKRFNELKMNYQLLKEAL